MKPIDLGIDTGTDHIQQFKPNMIWLDGMSLLFRDVPESVKDYARRLRDGKNWMFYAVSQRCGRCYYSQRVITIPKWAIISPKQGYKIYYIAHELAHAYDDKRSGHGDPFMQRLIEICPPEWLHYELGYKPRNAARNGIGVLPNSGLLDL